MKEILKNSGIDIIQFKTDSTRSVASSEVGKMSLCVQDILESEN